MYSAVGVYNSTCISFMLHSVRRQEKRLQEILWSHIYRLDHLAGYLLLPNGLVGNCCCLVLAYSFKGHGCDVYSSRNKYP